MSKRIKASTPDGQRIWILSPNARMMSYVKNGRMSYLDAFFLFGQYIVPPPSAATEAEEGKMFSTKRKILIELDDKISNLKFFAQEIYFYEKRLLRRRDTKRNIYDYRPYQIVIGHVEAYLDILHSIRDYLVEIEKHIGSASKDGLMTEQWFKIAMDLRHIFHHVAAPLCTIDNGKIQLLFAADDIAKLKHGPQYFKKTIIGAEKQIVVEMEAHDLADDPILFLNKWAKLQLQRLPPDTEAEVITRISKKGRATTRTIRLVDALKFVRQ